MYSDCVHATNTCSLLLTTNPVCPLGNSADSAIFNFGSLLKLWGVFPSLRGDPWKTGHSGFSPHESTGNDNCIPDPIFFTLYKQPPNEPAPRRARTFLRHELII